MPKKSTSRQRRKKQSFTQKLGSLLISNKVLGVSVFALIFGGIGVYMLTDTKALVADYPTFENNIVDIINTKRQNNGLSKLTHTICFHDRALSYARTLANKNKLVHSDLSQYFKTCPNGDKPYYAGEVLAKGSKDAAAIVNAWMNSDDHRKILMSKMPNTIGIGAAKGSDGNFYIVGATSKCDNGPCGGKYTGYTIPQTIGDKLANSLTSRTDSVLGLPLR